ncbi:MAG: TlpA family protein disulfide reductase, partial [Desulfobacteria bacterium]
MTKRPVSPAVVLILTLLIVPAFLHGVACAEGKTAVGDIGPLFSTTDLTGKAVSLEEILKSGKVVLLNFWGMRCGNCINEIGHLNPLHDKYVPSGAVFLGINVDGAPAAMLNRMMPKMPNVPKYTVIPDPDMKIPDLYNLSGAPLSIIIGRDGKV